MSKRSLIVALLVWISMPLTAQRIYRTEFTPYDTREDALSHSHAFLISLRASSQ